MAILPVLFGSLGSTLTCLILLGFAVFLILLVLVQRGKGGGLSGAFGGGMGGQSAFGTKAGDTFTRITVVTATLWIVFCIISAKYLGVSSGSRFAAASGAASSTPTQIPAPPLGEIGGGTLGEDGSDGELLDLGTLGGGDPGSTSDPTETPTSDPGADSPDATPDAKPPLENSGN